MNTEADKVSEQQAMQAENAIAYIFYRKVPGYGKNGVNEITGPRTYYNTTKRSKMFPYGEYDKETLAGMTWAEWEKIGAGYVPAY